MNFLASLPQIKKVLPPPVRSLFRPLAGIEKNVFLTFYTWRSQGRRHAISREATLPPLELRVQVGPFYDPFLYQEEGRQFVRYLREFCGLQPQDRILDIGCGCGLVAVPLTQYLTTQGAYEGVDIVPSLVQWCQDHISSRKFPHFHFSHSPLYNGWYHKKGTLQASLHSFPYPDSSFDVILIKGIFSYLFSNEIERYLFEVARLLKKNKRCLITGYLLNSESRRGMSQAGQASLLFKFPVKQGLATHRKTPERAIAYEETYLRSLYKKSGLAIVEPIHYGSWYRKKGFDPRENYQDIIIASKP